MSIFLSFFLLWGTYKPAWNYPPPPPPHIPILSQAFSSSLPHPDPLTGFLLQMVFLMILTDFHQQLHASQITHRASAFSCCRVPTEPVSCFFLFFGGFPVFLFFGLFQVMACFSFRIINLYFCFVCF